MNTKSNKDNQTNSSRPMMKSEVLRPREGTSAAKRLATLVGALFAMLMVSLAGQEAAVADVIGGGYPQAIGIRASGVPGPRTMPVTAHHCFGTGSGYQPQIMIGGGAAHRSATYPNTTQNVWYRAYVQRYSGAGWTYFAGGTSWEKQTIQSFSSFPATFWGANVPVVRGYWYRVVEEYVFDINGRWIGDARNTFNQPSYVGHGAGATLNSGDSNASACQVL